MLEITFLSLFVGSLGLQATAIGGWMRWYQAAVVVEDEQEEEILTRYESKLNAEAEAPPQPNGSAQGLARELRLAGWEFKIVRSNRDLFRDPVVFQRLCDEEGEAGWILLEKLDDRRVRFKRPVALRDLIKPERLKFDPYRCHYGSSSKPLMWLGGIASLTMIVVSAYLGYALVATTLKQSPGGLPTTLQEPLTPEGTPEPSPQD
ncbi:hypothetical protein [Argonema antarcticum]|uniref:hypothetical protein n=1 Tax=Argonema antarcticum TaxID=2942763 RepID=UPI00201398E8|nr:hypothetical protein [Argonema antarcticum]MCL1471669.1 hypothetical protein [Argonema antarcticum A004/B2]